MAEMTAAAPADNALSPKLKSTSEILEFLDDSLVIESSLRMFLSNSTFLVAVANPIHEGKPCRDEPTTMYMWKCLTRNFQQFRKKI